MLTNANDLLLLVIATCLAVLTIFTAWGIFYAVMILRDVARVSASLRKKFELLDGVLKLVKEKLENTSASLGLLVDGVSKIVKYFQERSEQKAASGKRKKKAE